MAQVAEQDFFGGAIRGVVPQRWIDGRSVYRSPMFNMTPYSLGYTFLESIYHGLNIWAFTVIPLDPASHSISRIPSTQERKKKCKINILTPR
jgi:hypothetical protein